jgi:hypothetical protein
LRTIELLPLQTGNFFAPLSSERQKLNDAPVGPRDFSGGQDNVGEFVVVQHSVASDFLRRQWHAFGRGLIEDCSAHAPPQERFGRLQGLIRSDRRPPLLDGGDDLNDIAFGNVVDAPSGPGLAKLPTKKPSDLLPRAVLRQTLPYEGLQQILDSVRHDTSICRSLLGRRVSAL